MKMLLMLLVLLYFTKGYSQISISRGIPEDTTTLCSTHIIHPMMVLKRNKTLAVQSFIIPTVFIGYGFAALHNHNLLSLNHSTSGEIREDNPHFLTGADTYMQFTPGVAVYALNLIGIHGKNNFRDRTMIYALSNIISTAIVFPLKKITHEERPDHSNFNSFPSGHTATAFAAAEFLRQEYKGVSAWYGIAGYAVAAATGILRMYNNKHWLSDVVAGAGVGIMSTKLAYIIYPAIQKKLFKIIPGNAIIMPYYQNGGGGLACVYHFHN
ncbi:MAG: phosphatase PAP2 family protein [Flavitalea sp.]